MRVYQRVHYQPWFNMLIALAVLLAAWVMAFHYRSCSPGETPVLRHCTISQYKCMHTHETFSGRFLNIKLFLAETITSKTILQLYLSQHTQTLKMMPLFIPPQAPLFSGCQDPSSWGPAVLCCHQRRALSSRFIHIQRQDQTLCKQTEGDLQQGEVQWWKVALGQWTHIILISRI